MNMCFEWCLVKAHKAQEIDPLLVKLTHLSGLKGQRASGGSTPPFWKREMKGRGNFNSVKHLTESGQPVGHTGQLTCGTWRQTFPNSNGLCYILIFDKRARKISTMVLYLNQKLCETVFFFWRLDKMKERLTLFDCVLPCCPSFRPLTCLQQMSFHRPLSLLFWCLSCWRSVWNGLNRQGGLDTNAEKRRFSSNGLKHS